MGILVDFFKRKCEKTWFALSVALVMGVLTVALPIVLGGFRQTADMQSHLHFARAFRAGIAVGDLYPGWASDNLGFGSVGIRFYPPVTPFVSAILHVASGNWHFAFSLSMFIWMVVGCFGVYLLVREWSTPAYGIFAGILYAVVPYHIAEVYRFFLYAEFAGLAVVPFCFLFLTRLCRRGSWGDVAPLALSFSVLILTHIPLTLMTAFSLLVYIPIAIDRSRWKAVSLQLFSSGIVVLCATACYWIRIVTELLWVAHADTRYTIAGYERGPMFFPFLLGAYDQYEYPVLRHLDIVTVLTITLLVPSLAVVFARRSIIPLPSLRVLAAATCSAVFGVFMFSKLSEVLWHELNILQRLQYPWRWLGIVSLLSVVSVSLSVYLLVQAGRVSRRIVLYGAVLITIGFAVVDIKQIHGTPFRISGAQFNELAAEIGSEPVAEHWWPSWAKAEAFKTSEPVVTADRRSVEIITWENTQRRFVIGEGESEKIRLATFYYPHWRASVNGLGVDVGKDENGAITLPIARERGEVELRFVESLSNTLASWLAVVTWILLLGSLAVRFDPLRRKILDLKQ